MDMLIRLGMSRIDAAQVASKRNNKGGFRTIGVDKTNQKYDESKDWLQKVTKYSESPKDVLQFVSEAIRRKYPNIFDSDNPGPRTKKKSIR